MRRISTSPTLAGDKRSGPGGLPLFTMAFQPIVDIADGTSVFAYEALVRGRDGSPARKVMGRVNPGQYLAFDAACRQRALGIASRFDTKIRLSVNISAAALCHYRHGLHATLKFAREIGWPHEDLIFEMTEVDPVKDEIKLVRLVAAARKSGIAIAIDDLGAGYASIRRFLGMRPSLVKLDSDLVRGVDSDRMKQALVRGIIEACASIDCRVIAEGVETRQEFRALSELGIELMQGYLFAPPAIASLPELEFPFPESLSRIDGSRYLNRGKETSSTP